jgi:hypothetical protein
MELNGPRNHVPEDGPRLRADASRALPASIPRLQEPSGHGLRRDAVRPPRVNIYLLATY